MLRTLIGLAISLSLLGCAEGNSIYHNRALSPQGDRVITLDAKQRNLLITRDRDNEWRVCAEAAPDVFSALSASASLDANIATKSGRAAAAIAEAAGTIERTQTVNLLRESMYRTCERYLDGSIGKAQLIVQAARDQRAMVKILAIEQLTRAARAPSTILMPPSTSVVSVDGDIAAGMIKDFAKERSDANDALQAASNAYDKATKVGKCDTINAAPADDSGDPKLSDWTTCKAAAATKAAREKDVQDASNRLDNALAAAPQLASTASGSTGSGTEMAGGGGSGPSDVALEHVADAVANIVQAPDIDEPLMFCIAYLDPTSKVTDRSDGATTARCLDILEQRAKSDEEIRTGFIDAGGNRVSIIDYHKASQSRAVSILSGYISSPEGKSPAAVAERKRRIALVQTAAQRLGKRLKGQDVFDLSMGTDPALAAEIIQELKKIETSTKGKSDLSI